MRILLDEVIQTDYGQFDLLLREGAAGFDGDRRRFFRDQVNDIVGAAAQDGSLYIDLATWHDAAVRIELLDQQPQLDFESFDVVVEVSATVSTANPRWARWGNSGGGQLDLPEGTYRVRTSIRARVEARRSEYTRDPVMSHYLLQFWSAPADLDWIAYSLHRSPGG